MGQQSNKEFPKFLNTPTWKLDYMVAKEEKHGMPALFSFIIPGMGQIIKGQVGKGLWIMIAMVISIIAIFGGPGFISTPILWIWNVYDAYNAN